jgi:hypothetical protein
MMINTKSLEEKVQDYKCPKLALNIPSFVRSSEYSNLNCSIPDLIVEILLFKSYSKLYPSVIE